jgi:hypothetical protein
MRNNKALLEYFIFINYANNWDLSKNNSPTEDNRISRLKSKENLQNIQNNLKTMISPLNFSIDDILAKS